MTSMLTGFLSECIDNKDFSCASYVIGNSNGVIESNSLGHLYWGGPKVEDDSLYDLASVTKPIAVLPLMCALEEGKICLEDTVDLFLEEYRNTDKAKITLRQLLTHTSGLPGQQPNFQVCKTANEMKKSVRELHFANKPDTKVEYSSQGFMILGDIIEAIEKKTLDLVLKEKVFNPLNMDHTFFNPVPSIISKCVATEDCIWRGKIVRGQVHDENSVVLGGVTGHAGLFSTLADLSKLCQAMLQAHKRDFSCFLKSSTVNLMSKNHTKHLNLARGLGWQGKDKHNSPIGDYFSPQSYGHTGFTGTSIWIDPETDGFAILLTNRVHPTRKNDSIIRNRKVFHNLSYLQIKSNE
ncbi:serine hydrolase domain-containing protein [Sporosarcina psychrophila]|uniref:serine hydrolase domain-containing protein n=1 Tax=Sporosarcina psychrophila TaxID=1476 RepID=UPI00078BEBDA|nr:serine hydrolase domain-containing protein [Sporosarcina psychrophila]AMQ07702.1 hypothetical protein AZE41_18130 [Sporosarcina psychrophila]